MIDNMTDEEYRERMSKALGYAFRDCEWCTLEHNKYLFKQIEELNGQYPIACPWCGKHLGEVEGK